MFKTFTSFIKSNPTSTYEDWMIYRNKHWGEMEWTYFYDTLYEDIYTENLMEKDYEKD